MDATLPEAIGNFRIVSKLGQGGMGAVFRAMHGTLERPVALKILPPEFSTNPEYVSRFLREARTVAGLRHENIVQVYDAGEQNGQYYIAMELVDGHNLLSYLEEKKQLSEQEGLDLLLQAAKGLAAAHAKGLVHRDIKPENILMGKDNILRIVDFGLVMESTSTTQLTATGACLGTPMYMSPEQADGEQADARTDIYSLGVTFYRIFTGQPPFNSATVMNLLFKHKFEAPPDPKTLRPGMSQDVRNLLLNMMTKRREDRPQDGKALAEMIEGLKAGKKIPEPPVFIPPSSAGTSVTMISQPHGQAVSSTTPIKPGMIAAAVIGVLLVGGLLYAFTSKGPGDGASSTSTLPPVVPEKTDYAAKGDQHFEAGRFTDAMESYQSALRENPNNDELKSKIAKTEKAIELDKVMQAAADLEAKGELEAAARRYEEAVALDSSGKAKDRLARVKTAIAQNKNLNNKEKNTERDAQSKLAAEAEQAGKYELAAEHYGRAAALSDPGLRIVFADKAKECRRQDYLTRAVAAEELRNYTDAESWYKKALELKPADALVLQQLESLQQKMKPTPAANGDAAFDTAMREGQRALDAGDLPKARAQYTAATVLKPGNISAMDRLKEVEGRELLAKGDALKAAGNNRAAEAAYTEAIQKSPMLAPEAAARIKALGTTTTTTTNTTPTFIPPVSTGALARVDALVRDQKDSQALEELVAALRANPASRELKDAKTGLETLQACTDLYTELDRVIEAGLGRARDARDVDDDERFRELRDSLDKLRARFTEKSRKARPLFLERNYQSVQLALTGARSDASELGRELSSAAEACDTRAEKAAEKSTGVKGFGISIGVGGDKRKAQKYRDISEGFRRLADQAKSQSK